MNTFPAIGIVNVIQNCTFPVMPLLVNSMRKHATGLKKQTLHLTPQKSPCLYMLTAKSTIKRHSLLYGISFLRYSRITPLPSLAGQTTVPIYGRRQGDHSSVELQQSSIIDTNTAMCQSGVHYHSCWTRDCSIITILHSYNVTPQTACKQHTASFPSIADTMHHHSPML